MKRALFTVVLLSSFAALAQKSYNAFPSRAHAQLRSQTSTDAMPLGTGSNFLGKTPKLRSWVVGWGLTGTKVDSYEVRCDDVFTDCAVPILRTKALSSEPYGMGSLTHSESADVWRGQRVELRAELRAGRIGGWAGLWMRIDDKDGKVLAFDNMQNRAIRGTTSFQWYSVVLDVPQEAEKISFGVMLHGPGAIFIRELQFEEVDRDKVGATDLVAPLRAQSPGGATGGAP